MRRPLWPAAHRGSPPSSSRGRTPSRASGGSRPPCTQDWSSARRSLPDRVGHSATFELLEAFET
eukprot:8073466-Alexandrium_andersonii.AAC.1